MKAIDRNGKVQRGHRLHIDWVQGAAKVMGYIHASYGKLVEVFGEPNYGSYMFGAEWVVHTLAGMTLICTDMDDRDYLGECENLAGEWEVQAHSKEAYRIVKNTLGLN